MRVLAEIIASDVSLALGSEKRARKPFPPFWGLIVTLSPRKCPALNVVGISISQAGIWLVITRERCLLLDNRMTIRLTLASTDHGGLK